MMSLSVAERRELAGAWIELHKASQGSDAHASLFWAYLKLDGLIRSDPKEAWLAIMEIARLDDGETTLENLGAGPLEDLLVYHGQEIIACIEARAVEPHIPRLARYVWKNAMSDDIWSRLQSVARRTR